MARKRRNRVQVTCLCRAYKFPHRLGGGKCAGRGWAESYYLHEKDCCAQCNLNTGDYCEVAVGQEDIKHCEGYQEHLRLQPSTRLPIDENQFSS